MTAPRRSASSTRTRLLAGIVGRVVLLVLLVVGSGVAAGYAIGYPLRRLDLGGPGPVTLDHFALVGEFDPSDALVAQSDLPDDWVLGDPALSAQVALVGAEYCGQAAPVDGQLGNRLSRAYVDAKNDRLLLSEVVRVRRQNTAGAYVDEVGRLLSGCPNKLFFAQEGAERVKIEIRDDRRNPPVADYVTRTLVTATNVRIITYFQVGNVIVALQYAGPPNPPRTLMDGVEREILARVAPDQFSKTTKVKGQKPLPPVEGPATSTTVDPAQPSPTSSPPPPPTVAPTPTFETPKSTTTAKPRKTASKTTTTGPP